MKRPLLVLFCLTALGIWLWYPRSYTADPVFPQGMVYDVIAEGELLSCERKKNSFALTLTDCTIFYQDRSYFSDRLLVTTDASPQAFQIGNTLQITGALSSFSPARNPGNFDWRSYYLSRHISYRIYADNIVQLHDTSIPWRQTLWNCHQTLVDQLPLLAPKDGETTALLTALLLGSKISLPDETLSKYENGGILHILTVSGLHVSLLGGAVLSLCKKLYFPPWLRAAAAASFVIWYWYLCGSGLSTGRAVIMFLCMILAPLLSRSYDSLSALSLAGLILLWDSPLMLFQAGFQLSFGAILGIQLVCPSFSVPESASSSNDPPDFDGPQATAFSHRLFSKLSTVSRSLYFGLGLQLTLLPITLYHFFQYPLYGLFLNLLVLPLTAPLLFCGAASLVLSLFCLPLGQLLVIPCQWILSFYDLLCSTVVTLPGSSSLLGRPTLSRIFCYYGTLALLCLFFQKRRRQKRNNTLLLIPAGLLLTTILLLPLPSRTLSITFLDVGQGDCSFLQTADGTTVLIDGGSSDLSNAAQDRLIPFLGSHAVDHLDHVFFSHSDADHTNLMTAWLEAGYTIGHAYVPQLPSSLSEEASYQALLRTLEAFSVPVTFLKEDMVWHKDGLTLTCLAPRDLSDRSVHLYRSLNSASLVLLADYQDIRILFTGDCCDEGETLLLQTLAEKNTDCHILKAGHHGSAGATGTELLRRLNDPFTIISCGIRNRYGHPSPDMLKRLEQQNISWRATASCGAVTVRIQDGQAQISTMLSPGPLYYR